MIWYFEGGFGQKEGGDFFKEGFTSWCLLWSRILDALVSCFSNFMGSNFNFNYHNIQEFICCQQKKAQILVQI